MIMELERFRDMDNPISSFVAVLDEVEDIVQELIKVSAEKTDVLVKSDIEGINRIVEKEHSLRYEIDRSEKKRKEAALLVASYLNIPKEASTNDIIENVQEPWKSELFNKTENIKKLLDEYKNASNICNELIKSHLSFVDYMVNTLTGSRDDVPPYGVDGYSQQNLGQKIIDNKV